MGKSVYDNCPRCGQRKKKTSQACDKCARQMQHRGTPQERFWRKVDKSASPDGCWLWTGAKHNAGYGQLRVDGKSLYAHRLVYEWEIGPIPDGYTIDHICCNHSCVNPAHLEAVTITENLQRGNKPFNAHARRPGRNWESRRLLWQIENAIGIKHKHSGRRPLPTATNPEPL